MNALRRHEIWLRVAALFALFAGALTLRAFDPAGLPAGASCGAALGLPCIFCGTTRALHCLLNGDLARALYFNWLAFPVAAFALLLGAKFALEIARGRRVAMPFSQVRFTPRIAAAAGGGLVALWVLQIALALHFGKQELLNPNGVLYTLFVR